MVKNQVFSLNLGRKDNKMINFTLTKEKMKEFAELFSVETSPVKDEVAEDTSEEISTNESNL